MATPEAQIKEFQRLAGEAQAGNFYIEVGAARDLVNYCKNYITELRTLAGRAENIVVVDSFSNFESSRALGEKFSELATGGSGTGSYTAAITEHIKILEALADMYTKAGAAFEAADAETQAKIKAQTHKLDW
ncbi:hypothetical protein [Nocardia goodfellowii]|uniref:PE domain-containing protein n=1 Tax=Nocardia goodfellowii TaxID=882446 RepID=A0ABS4QNS8_9NOCA|nr:hypothetical protein [Nocardia goodfellowii]MBP2193347.1 hypothetical protein [Nocardia goodfellowii]